MSQRTIVFPTSYELALSPKETYVAALGRNVIVANLRTNQRQFSGRPLSDPSHAAFNHAESTIAVKNTAGHIAVLDVSDGSVLTHRKSKDHDEGAPLHYSACDQFLVDGSWNGFIRVRRSDDLSLVEEFKFAEEMIVDASATTDRTCWLFVHQPKTREGENWPPAPYITIWEWPFRSPRARIEPGYYRIGAASLSPSGDAIAIVGSPQRKGGGGAPVEELRVLDITGSQIATASVRHSGAQLRARWSDDGKLVGTTDKAGIMCFDSRSLSLRNVFQTEYASDIAFIQSATHAVLGTLKKGWVVAL